MDLTIINYESFVLLQKLPTIEKVPVTTLHQNHTSFYVYCLKHIQLWKQ